MSDTTTLVHIRSYQPLSVSFPAPGEYIGKIVLILPGFDPSVLSRVGGQGESPLAVVLEAKDWVSASQLRSLILRDLGQLKAISAKYSAPVRKNEFKGFGLSTWTKEEEAPEQYRRRARVIDEDSELFAALLSNDTDSPD